MNLILILGISGFIGLGSILKAAALTQHWRRNRRFLRFRFHEPVDVVISTDKRLDAPLTETGRTYPRFVRRWAASRRRPTSHGSSAR